jgi:glycosyltransferase involved in cell wall biosynthesis
MASEFASVRVVRASDQPSLGGEDVVPASKPKGIYLAWVNYQRRAESMQRYFGYDLFYISSRHLSPARKLLSYVVRARKMLQIVLRERPDVVWVQLPPTFLVHLLVLFRFVTRRRMKIVSDCHNAALRSPWSIVPLSVLCLNRTNLVLVHNRDIAPAARDLGIDRCRLGVLGDCVPVLPAGETDTKRPARTVLVMPCSFHADEPIEAVLQAARQLESATFVITGNHLRIRDRGLLEKASGNVIFPGFLPSAEFDRLLLHASAVLCLTTQEGIQLSTVSEAIAAGKPMIISDTALLRDFVGHAGIFVDNSVTSILQGCRIAIECYGDYAAAARELRARRMTRWLEEAEPVRLQLAT